MESGNPFLAGGGEMGRLTRQYDWGKSILGVPESWPLVLLNTVSIILKANFPMFLWWGEDLIQFYNDAYRPSLGVTGKHPSALGQKGVDCWPEIWPVIYPLIKQVMSGQGSTWMEDALIPIYRNNRLEDVYWTFSYSYVYESEDKPGGVLVICSETTEKVKYQRQLEKTVTDLHVAEKRLRYILQDAPLPIATLTGRNLIIENANKQMLDIWGKSSEIIGSPLAMALPELEGQPFLQILDEVYTTGIPYYGHEMRALLERAGKLQEVYADFVYYPIKGIDEKSHSIMLVVSIITEKVMARKELERSRDNLQLAHRAAEIGTFNLDFELNELEWDERCRKLFGLTHNNPVSYEKDFVQGLHPQDRQRVLDVIATALNKNESNGNYDVEYRTVGAEDGKIRWVRAKGKVYFNADLKPQRFLGAVLDITSEKQLEIRKFDFITMVSHELKTPLASLKGFIYLVSDITRKQNDELLNTYLEKISRQVGKMNSMINSFLRTSKVEAGKIKINKKPFLLNNLLKEAIEEIKMLSNQEGFCLADGEPTTVHADYEKISQVLSNLLNNAVKYSPAGSMVKLYFKKEEGQVIVSVQDEGYGISESDKLKIFERFYRAESPETKTVAGFGIGLYLCSAIIQQHGGRIWVSRNTDRGSTFHFSIPASSEI